LSGSAKRIKDLQTIFDSPEKYGKGLDWAGYTVHDAANVLRRYLNCLPEPIIPLDFYNKFRDPLTVQPETFDVDHAISIYQKLILELPPLNRQLLLYILDLLAVFASKSEINRMTAENLAAIFQPGLISHPSHEMAPQAYKLSQDVLVFLINHQDHFLMGMRGSNEPEAALDPTSAPATPSSLRHSKTVVHRSTSGASAGADDIRMFGGVRRNASVSSRKSGTNSGGVSRSNTLPSKRSPRTRPSASFRPTDGSSSSKPTESIGTESAAPVGAGQTVRQAQVSRQEPLGPQHPPRETRPRQVSGSSRPTSPTTPTWERNFANLFSLAPADGRQQRKLRKSRLPGSNNGSAESSQTSLPYGHNGSAETPLETIPSSPPRPIPSSPPRPIPASVALPSSPPSHAPGSSGVAASTSTLLPTMSPTPSATSSVTSQDSAHSYSDATGISDSPGKKKARSSRWRWSNSKVDQWNPGSPTFGNSSGSIAERIRNASGSPDHDRSEGSGDDSVRSGSSKGGPLGWFKKRTQRKEDQDDKDIPIHVQVQHLPPPQYPLPASPQIQPPTPSSLRAAPIAEAENEYEEANMQGPWVQEPETPTPTQDKEILRNVDLRVDNSTPKPTPAEASSASTESDTPKATQHPSPEKETSETAALTDGPDTNASLPRSNGIEVSTAEPIAADTR
jgi:hypothetical protein